MSILMEEGEDGKKGEDGEYGNEVKEEGVGAGRGVKRPEKVENLVARMGTNLQCLQNLRCWEG